MNKKSIFILLVLSAYLSLGGGASSDYPKMIVDSAGREVTIQMPVERIIILNTDGAEAVRLLGATNKVVGVTDSITKKSYYFPEFQDREVIGTWKEFDYEKIGKIAMGDEDFIVPDIIVISYTYRNRPYGVFAVEEGLAPFENITVLGLDLYKQETLKDEMRALGTVLGREETAEDYCNWCEEKEEDVESAVKGLDAPKVYIQGSDKGGLGALSTYGEGSALNDLCRMAGGDNIAKDLAEYPKVDWEWVIDQNPDVIVKIKSVNELGWSDTSELEEVIDEITGRPGAESISAVKNDRVYVCYWGMHFGADSVVGLTYWARLFHPSVDLDPGEVYREYLGRIGLVYPEGKIFVYPAV
ncbi:MAG: ABC transporter substrate-binding protein [Methanotrichaceae archaeon]